MKKMYNTRYWFIKKVYPNYLLLFKTNNNRYITFLYRAIVKDIVSRIRVDAFR